VDLSKGINERLAEDEAEDFAGMFVGGI